MVRTTALIATLLAFLLPGATSALELEDCRISAGPSFPGIKARCGVIRRPENPADPESRDIDIRVAVVPALSLTPEPDPFVPLAGGPGQGAIQFYSSYAEAFERVRRTRDILLVDQRGTGQSSPMQCEVNEALIEGRYSIEQVEEYTRQCLRQLPHDPRYFTTSVAVTDLEAVREALSYPVLNLYGVSYGSRVAQHFARRYPHATRTIVLDGVVPPQLALGTEIASESQRALENILARCAGDDACNDRFPNVQRSFERLLARLSDEPVSVEMTHPVTGHRETVDFGRTELGGAIRLLAYHHRSMAIIPLLIHEAANGNYTPLVAQFYMAVESLVESLAIGMHNSGMRTEPCPTTRLR